MTDSTRKYIKLAQDYVMITLGLFTYAFGFTAFILPEKIVIGSVTGLSSLIHYWVGWNVAGQAVCVAHHHRCQHQHTLHWRVAAHVSPTHC